MEEEVVESPDEFCSISSERSRKHSSRVVTASQHRHRVSFTSTPSKIEWIHVFQRYGFLAADDPPPPSPPPLPPPPLRASADAPPRCCLARAFCLFSSSSAISFSK